MSTPQIVYISIFIFTIIISTICIIIAKKMELPAWKFRVAWILFMDLLSMIVVISKLNNG